MSSEFEHRFFKEFTTGDKKKIEGTTLVPIYKVRGATICKCDNCGHIDRYSVQSDIISKSGCHKCSDIMAIKDIHIDRGEKGLIDKLKREEEQIARGEIRDTGSMFINTSFDKFKNIQRGDKIGNTIVTGTYGIYKRTAKDGIIGFNTPEGVVIECTTCPYAKTVDLRGITKRDEIYDKLNKAAECPNCHEIIKRQERIIQDKIKDRTEEKEKPSKEELEYIQESVSMTAAAQEEDKAERVVVSGNLLYKDNKGKQLTEHIDKIIAYNHDKELLSLRRIPNSNRLEAKLLCKYCGYIITQVGLNGGRRAKCDKCDEVQLGKHFVGKLDVNNVGRVVNGLEIISVGKNENGVRSCIVKCIYCEKEMEAPLYDTLVKKVYCGCDKAELFVTEVGFDENNKSRVGHAAVKISDIIKMKNDGEVVIEGLYDREGNPVKKTKADLTFELNAEDYKRTWRIRYNKSKEIDLGNTKIENNHLIVEEKILYAAVGDSDKLYMRCRCMEHNRDLILSEEDIDNFDHEQCFEHKEHMIKDINVNLLEGKNKF